MRVRDLRLSTRAESALQRALWVAERQRGPGPRYEVAPPEAFESIASWDGLEADDLERRVLEISELDVLRLKNAGKKSLREIEDALASRGLRLRHSRRESSSPARFGFGGARYRFLPGGCSHFGEGFPVKLLERVLEGEPGAIEVLRDFALETGFVDDWLREVASEWRDRSKRTAQALATNAIYGKMVSTPTGTPIELEVARALASKAALVSAVRRESEPGDEVVSHADRCGAIAPSDWGVVAGVRCSRRRDHQDAHWFYSEGAPR